MTPLQLLLNRKLSTPRNDSHIKHRCMPDQREMNNTANGTIDQNCMSGIMESCLRLLTYDPVKRDFGGLGKHHADIHTCKEIVRNLRSVASTNMDEKKTAVRAAQASESLGPVRVILFLIWTHWQAVNLIFVSIDPAFMRGEYLPKA